GVVATNAIRERGLVARWIAHHTAHSTEGGPVLADRALNFPRAALWCPVDGTVLGGVVQARRVGSGPLIGDGIAQHTALRAERDPALTNNSLNLPRAGLWCPVDGAVLEVVVPAHPVGSGPLIGDGIAHHTALRSEGGPVLPDNSLNLPRAGLWCPVD